MQTVSKAILAAAAVISLGAAAPAARAQALDFTLDAGTQYGAPGSVLQFTGTLSNPSATDTVFLNGDTPSQLPPSLTLDDSPFVNNAPASLGPAGSGTDTYTGDFFDITIASTALPGSYTPTFEIQGGTDGNAGGVVASKDFTVVVLPQAVPEASSVTSLGLLLMFGLGGIIVVRRRKAQCS